MLENAEKLGYKCFSTDRDPALRNKAVLDGVDVEHVEGVVDGLDLPHLQHPRAQVARRRNLGSKL